MSQGKAYTEQQKETIIQSLKPYLELGFSRNKSCDLIGLAPTTLSNWVQLDEALGMRIEGWENSMNKLALANINSALLKEAEMDDARKETTKWWLERKLKAEFSTKVEQEVNFKELPKPILDVNIQEDNSDKQDNVVEEKD